MAKITAAMKPPTSNFGSKAAALLEVLGVFLCGNFLASHAISWFGMRSVGAILQRALDHSPPNWLAASLGWSQVMGFQYACLLAAAIAIGFWRRRAGLRYYGITTAGTSVWSLLGLGVIGFAVFGIVGVGVDSVLPHLFPLLSSPSILSPFLERPWTADFWLFLAVASFGFQPVIEELFYRGYCQSRLEEAFGGAPAIIIVSLFHALGHNQYYHLTFMAAATIAAVVLLSLGAGYVYWRTRSLIPAILVHALINVPLSGVHVFLLPAVLVVVLALFHRQAGSMILGIGRGVRTFGYSKSSVYAALIAIGATVAFDWHPGMVAFAGALGLVVAIALSYRASRIEAAN